MRYVFAILTLLSTVAASTAPSQLDLRHYFATASEEASSRAALTAQVNAFDRSSPVMNADGLNAWLEKSDTLRAAIERHDIYVYLRAEEDTDDVADARADDAMSELEMGLDRRIESVIAGIGSSRIAAMVYSSPKLARYRYFLMQTLARASHRLAPGEARAVAATVDPALSRTAASYKALRSAALAPSMEAASTLVTRKALFLMRWTPFIAHEDAFAAQLLAIVPLRNGVARLQGFAGAPAAAYFAQSLSPAFVARTLAAVRASDALQRYHETAALLAAAILRVAPETVHVYDLDALSAFTPPAMTFEQARATILQAEQPMGDAYASAFARLLDPVNARLELCTDTRCDRTGFSVGFAGSESGVYFGGYDGGIDRVRAVAHESGHAVHRQFMNEHQPIAAYNQGPNFMFESFAIFNELLFWDHLFATATEASQRIYYLNRFLDDATFQIFGSAQETDLEAQIYAGADAGTLKTASDLDALTTRTLREYDPLLAAEPEARAYWARDSLYYTDPLYDVSYLYAGLLALAYFDEYERDRSTFARNYVRLLSNGFDRSPADLERTFLGIDLGNEKALVAGASALIVRRTQ
ncbi:MAG: M3 family oligoendopeptidase, partial [Candidatus Eremiobacteraeota bacterium]|nr:M3 family oligoendopeptidase [Candidatus Eremiobacteraeota bacterium]